MNSPLWIINSILTVLLLAIILFIGMGLRDLSSGITMISIKPQKQTQQIQQEKPKVKDIRYIYEGNDLFGTHSITPPEIVQPIKVPEIPTPPTPKQTIIPPTPQIQFLEQLPVKITGIIHSNIEENSQVTLENTKTKESSSYKVGEKVLDAIVVRILPRKIIIIRSNGQQETLFMYQEDAQEEINRLKESSWFDVVKSIEKNTYSINTTELTKRVLSLAQFIEALDVTTAYEKGDSIGCRIGKIEAASLGSALGFKQGDIVIKINNIQPSTTKERIDIYNTLTTLKNNDTISLVLKRGSQALTNTYTIVIPDESIIQLDKASQEPEIPKYNIEEEARKPQAGTSPEILAYNDAQPQLYSVHPQVGQLKKHERKNMFDFGSKGSVLKSMTY